MIRIYAALQRLPNYAAHLGIGMFLLWVFVLSVSIIFKLPDLVGSNTADFQSIERPACIAMPNGLKVCDRR